MSATSEELSAQAEQLQSTIAFFRVDDGAIGLGQTRPAAAARRPARPAAAVKYAPPRKPRPTPSPRAASAQAESAQAVSHNAAERAKSNGFALNLTAGSADRQDAEFERM
jgi:methyl-accepting chemotaxis protein